MKTSFLLLSLGALLIIQTQARAADIRAESAPAIVERGPHHRVWQRTIQETLPSGKVRTRTSGFTELASGMHRWDAQGSQWVDSRDTIEIFGGGAVARQGAHKVIFAPNANTAGAVDLLTPDGIRLRSHVLGIAVYEPKTGESEMIGSIKDAVGELHPPNVVVYPDAIDGVNSYLRYTYTIGGFEQDVILTDQIVLPEGWDPGSVLIQVWTEFLDGVNPGVVPGSRRGMADDTLSFGGLQTGSGHAFALGEELRPTTSLPVAKRWAVVEGRGCLVESIPYSSLKKELEKLPARQAKAAPPAGGGRHPKDFCPFPSSPPTRQARATKPPESFRTASLSTSPRSGVVATPPDHQSPPSQRGYVIDYILQASYSNFTFAGDTTYVASNTVTLTGTTTFEGGCVVKFSRTNTATLSINGPDVWNTSSYRPAIFTSVDDNSAGDAIGSGSPTGYYGGKMLYYAGANGGSPSHVRFSYAATAVAAQNPTIIRHAQFIHSNKAIEHNSASGVVTNENVLFYDISTLYQGGSYFAGRHLTIHICTNFSAGGDYSGQLLNSLVIGLNSWGPFEISQTSCYVSGADDPSVFSVVGAAAHYLAANSVHRNAGSTLSGTLANDIKQRTTYPPMVIQPNGTYTNSIVLSPQAQRDTDTPDRGYHYDPMDYAVGVMSLQDASITIMPGTAVGLFSPSSTYAIGLFKGASLISDGSADSRNRIVRYNTVQEQATTNWGASVSQNILTDAGTASPIPQARFRFTDWSVLAGAVHFSAQTYNDNAYAFRDCQFNAGMLVGARPNLAFTNCLFNRVMTILDDGTGDYATTAYDIHNSTFHGGRLEVYHYNTARWSFTDNLFDDTTLVQDGAVTNDYNAYTTNLVATRLTPTTGNHDVMLAVSNFTFQTWGADTFYIPTNSALTNAGSTWATNVGLYHFTTTTNQVKEAASKVDIGWHYVSVTNGVPIDTDGDGLADYFEDVNGNGSLDSGETATTSAIDWGLKVYITRPRKGNNLP